MSPSTNPSLDNELSAVNTILNAIGQSPVSSFDSNNPELSLIHNILIEVSKDVQNEGWTYNTERHIKVSPNSNNNIVVSEVATSLGVPTLSRIDVHDGLTDRTINTVIRDNGGTLMLYDKLNHTFTFNSDQLIDVVFLVKFEHLPSVFQRYITLRAAGRAATQLVANPQLVQLLSTQEMQARSTCIDYECDQEDPSFLVIPDDTTYRSFIPSDALRR
jgi:hypothetical protein